jgi:hypothetical protein
MDPTRYTPLMNLWNEDARRRSAFMHLVQGDDCLIGYAAWWETTCALALGDGKWQPLGTDAPASDLSGTKGYQTKPSEEGHYIPVSQKMVARDALRLARAVLLALPIRDPMNGAESHRVPATRWLARASDEVDKWIPARLLAQHWSVAEHADTLCEFLCRGGDVRIVPGLPACFHADEQKRVEDARREREIARITEELEAPARRLAELRAGYSSTNVA